MGRSTIPVDLRNPGQVFACLGFLEAAEILCGPAEGGFVWDDGDERFLLDAEGAETPVATVLEFLAGAKITRLVPAGWVEPAKKPKTRTAKKPKADSAAAPDSVDEDIEAFKIVNGFPAAEGDRMALPIRLGNAKPYADLGHWADQSSRDSFKLYAGNRTAAKIAADMLDLVSELWGTQREALIERPLDTLCPMGGSFNFDPRGAWTAIDAGYSPNEHKHRVMASPVVEIMAAWGLDHARPDEFELRQVCYAVWNAPLPPILARAALGGGVEAFECRRFAFPLALSGKNKVVCFSQEDSRA